MTLTFADDELDVVIAALSRLAHDAEFDDFADEDQGSDNLAEAILDRIADQLPLAPAGPAPKSRKSDGPHHGTIRKAIHAETKLELRYVDRRENETHRTIWPLELGFVGAGETIAAWCEARRDFRHFRLDRIVTVKDIGERYPGRQRILLAQLRTEETDRGF